MQNLRALLEALNRFERAICAVCFGLLALLMVVDIFSREVLQQSFHRGPKLAIDLMIWGGFLGASLCVAAGTHLRIEAADRLWPDSWRSLVTRVQTLVTFAFCLAFAWVSAKYVGESRQMGEVGVVTGVPIWMVQLVIPVSFGSMAFRYLMHALFPALRPSPVVGEGR